MEKFYYISTITGELETTLWAVIKNTVSTLIRCHVLQRWEYVPGGIS